MFSYWEQQSFSHYNHVIIGAGITGVSLSIELAERFPEWRILVLERGLLPTGASTKNAGFACMGSATELLDDLAQMSEKDVVGLFAARKAGLERLRNRLGDARIGYTTDGSYELLSGAELYALDKLDYLNSMLRPVVNGDAFKPVSSIRGAKQFGGAYSKGVIENTCEGSLHTGMMMRTLTELARSKGVEIKTGAGVERFDEGPEAVKVYLKNCALQIQCDSLSICTNAFTKQLLPGEDIVPGRGQVLITDPVPGLMFKGIYHFDKGYYYFREIDGSVLLGGGRNLDFGGEQTTEMELSSLIQDNLEQQLREVILPGVPFRVAQRWAGIMAFGPTKQPIVKAVGKRVFGAFRLGGMGVAIGSKVAAELAAIIEEQM